MKKKDVVESIVVFGTKKDLALIIRLLVTLYRQGDRKTLAWVWRSEPRDKADTYGLEV